PEPCLAWDVLAGAQVAAPGGDCLLERPPGPARHRRGGQWGLCLCLGVLVPSVPARVRDEPGAAAGGDPGLDARRPRPGQPADRLGPDVLPGHVAGPGGDPAGRCLPGAAATVSWRVAPADRGSARGAGDLGTVSGCVDGRVERPAGRAAVHAAPRLGSLD